MTPNSGNRLVADFPHQVGNTDGVPWEMRIAANRTNIAQAIVDDAATRSAAPSTGRCSARSTIRRVAARRVDRQILAFDPARASLVELNGDLATARASRCWFPG